MSREQASQGALRPCVALYGKMCLWRFAPVPQGGNFHASTHFPPSATVPNLLLSLPALKDKEMKRPSTKTALIAAAIVALGAFVLLRIGGATAQVPCIQPVSEATSFYVDSEAVIVSDWFNDDCLSAKQAPDGRSGSRYARFYTFTLSAATDVTVTLKSEQDTYLYILEGIDKSGMVLHENDDITTRSDTNSRIEANLQPGDYTIEATTYNTATDGVFELIVGGLPASAPVPTSTTIAVDTPAPTSTPYPGQGTPKPIATFPPTPTATHPSVPTDVLNRLTELETLTATQQELLSTLESKITELDSRIAVLEADTPSSTPSSDACRVARPNGYQPFPETLNDFWDKRDNCLLEMAHGLRVTDEVEFGGFSGGHQHFASVRSPYSHSLVKYDTLGANNPNGTSWRATLQVPVSGLSPMIYVTEYNPHTTEWNTVAIGRRVHILDGRRVRVEWTPITGRTYNVVATLRRGFMESSFTLTYDFASGGASQGSQPQMTPSNVVPPQIEAILGSMEDTRMEDGDDVSAE